MSCDAYDLEKFVRAQALMYPRALREMQNGKKKSHWMWFVFPQLKGLGQSRTAVHYGLEGIEEAKAYLAHPVLGARLREITAALLAQEKSDPLEVMGYPDNVKLCSSMTLFAAACADDDGLFLAVIEKFFGGRKDALTLRLLAEEEGSK